jgi:hypothetical protein
MGKRTEKGFAYVLELWSGKTHFHLLRKIKDVN